MLDYLKNPTDESDLFDSAMLKIHDLSMSEHPERAARGRLLKLLHPMLTRWSDEELKVRDTNPGDVIYALGHAFVSEAAALVLAYAKDGQHETAMKKFADHLRDALHQIVDDPELKEQIAEAERMASEIAARTRSSN